MQCCGNFPIPRLPCLRINVQFHTLMHTVGIDLGTTNVVAARRGELLSIARGEFGEGVLPSVVSYPPDGGFVVGAGARARLAIDPRNTIVSAKRLMGARWGSNQSQTFRANYVSQLVPMAGGRVGFRTRSGDIDPPGVAALVLRTLARRADLDPHATGVVVSVPASFDEPHRRATFDAIDRAGFASGMVVDEPVATAAAYLARSNLRYAAVYDLGGGTFDCAIVDCSRYPFEVVGYAGDSYLGGDDIDRDLARHVAERYLSTTGWDLASDAITFARLVAGCEAAKRRLAECEWTQIDLLRVDGALPAGMPDSFELDRALLWSLTEPMVRQSFGICDEALANAGVKSREVEAVFLAGGSSLLHGLADYVGKYFDKRPRRDIDPMHVVGLGASIIAARPDLTDRYARAQGA